eukprot:Sspe_Gene.64995::Locus_38497_Transcript_1_2_Confidence_0.750_Length_2090::g.64995::m.64995/K00613/GATM; glycine amidinotransferase
MLQGVRVAVVRAGRRGGTRSASSSTPTPPTSKVVCSYTEWDPLEEVIVGTVEGATVPEWHPACRAVWPRKQWDFFKENQGKPFPKHLIDAATKELDYLVEVLEGEGITVRRPDVMNFSDSYTTPDFKSLSGMYAAMPRDVLIVVGDEIIEAPMAWRSRYFEFRPYRRLIQEYFRKGARWTAAPKPLMADDLYNGWNEKAERFNSVVTEVEPVFDAAEFTRVGRDIFCQLSHVTNKMGVEWMRRHLGPEYRIHCMDFEDRNGMHIDGTFIPLGEGKLLVNPSRPSRSGILKKQYTFRGKDEHLMLPEGFAGWDVFIAPESCLPADHPLYFTSPWTATANVLVIGNGKVICEAHEKETIKSFKEWGFTPIPVPFRNFLPFGGSFHCATCDIRRRGELRSYLNTPSLAQLI